MFIEDYELDRLIKSFMTLNGHKWLLDLIKANCSSSPFFVIYRQILYGKLNKISFRVLFFENYSVLFKVCLEADDD